MAREDLAILYFRDLMGALIWTLAVGAVIWAIVMMIRTPKRGSGAASLTAMHDLQPRDKQNAMETIIEMRSERRKDAQSSGEKAEDVDR